MLNQICIAGFGGQGVLAIGKSIVEAAMEEDYNVTWAPSYGPEMRGGTCNCDVIVSDKPIGSPIFKTSSTLIAMNLPSLRKFEGNVKPGGQIFINSSVIDEKTLRDDVEVYYVPCNDIAEELGNPKVANMVMMGAYMGATNLVPEEDIKVMIGNMFTGKKAKLVPLNITAYERGAALAAK